MLLGVFWQPFLNSSVIVQFVYTLVQFICASNIYCFINKQDLGLATYQLLSFVLLLVFFGQKNEFDTLRFGNSHRTFQCLHHTHILTGCSCVKPWFPINNNLYCIVLTLKLETKGASDIKAYEEIGLTVGPGSGTSGRKLLIFTQLRNVSSVAFIRPRVNINLLKAKASVKELC